MPELTHAPAPVASEDDPIEIEALCARTRRGVIRAGVALVLLQAVVRGFVGFRGYLFLDDYAFEHRAATHSLTSSGLLLDSWNGHLMPGSFAMVWVATHVAPLEMWPGVFMDLVLQTATGFVMLALLRELFGTRRAVLVPLALFLFTPATLTGFAWWAAAINQLPAMLAMTGCLLLHVRYLRSGRLRTGMWALVVFVVGLAFFEKLLLFAPAVWAFTAMYTVDGTALERVRRTAAYHWRLLLTWVAVLVPYTAYYLATVDSTVGSKTTPASFLDLLLLSWRGLAPTAIGGPWHWSSLGGHQNALPLVGDIALTFGTAAVALVVIAGAITYRQSARAWLFPGVYLVVTVALLAVGRSAFGALIGFAYRYFSEAAVLAALALGLAFLPLVGEVHRGSITVLQARSWVHALRERLDGTALGGISLSGHARTVLVRSTVVVLILSCLVTTVRFDALWSDNAGRDYVRTARAELKRAKAQQLILNDTVVAFRASALVPPGNAISDVFRPLPDRPEFLTLGRWSTSLHMLDDTGRVRQVAVQGVANKPGPRASCGWFASGAFGVAVPMAITTYDYVWTIRIGYIASEDTRAVIRAGHQTFHVQLSAGLNAVYLIASGPVSDVTIGDLAQGASVCTDDVRVGTTVPLP